MNLLSLALAFTCLSWTSAMNVNGINPGLLELLRYISQHNGQFPNFPNSMNIIGPQIPKQPAQAQQPPIYNQQAKPTQPTTQQPTATQSPVQPQVTTEIPVQLQTTIQPPVKPQQGSNQAAAAGQTGSTQPQQSPVPSTGTGKYQGLPAMPNMPGIPARPIVPSMPNYPPPRNVPNLALMAEINKQVAYAYRMQRKYMAGQVIPPMGFFPGGVVSSADGSDATVQTRFGPVDIDSFKFCPTEFNCMVVL